MSRSTCLGAVPRSPPVIAGGSGSGASLVSPLAWKASAPTMPFTLLRAAHSGSARPTPAAEAKGPERSRLRGTSVREKNRLARSQRGARGGSQRRLTGRHRTEDLATLRIGLWTTAPAEGDRMGCAPDGLAVANRRASRRGRCARAAARACGILFLSFLVRCVHTTARPERVVVTRATDRVAGEAARTRRVGRQRPWSRECRSCGRAPPAPPSPARRPASCRLSARPWRRRG